MDSVNVTTSHANGKVCDRWWYWDSPPEIDDMGCDRGKAFIAAVVMLFYKLDMRYCYYSTHLSL